MRNHTRSSVLTLTAALSLAMLAPAAPRSADAAAPAPVQLADLRKLVTLLDPQIAPDASRIALVARRPDFDKNRYVNELVLINARTGASRTLVAERNDVSSPAWSPAGDRLAFVATPAKDPDDKDEPSPQLYVLRMDGGEPVRLTDAKQGIDGFAWRPDGNAFAYVARDDAPDEKRIKAHDDWFEVTDSAWTARSVPVASHLWTVGADGKHAKRITHGTWSLNADPAFARDGRSVYVTRTPQASANHYRDRSVVRVDLASGAVREIARRADSPLVTKDGRVLFGGEHPQAFSQSELYSAAADGRDRRDLTARLDRNVQFAVETPYGIVVGAADVVHDRLYVLQAGAPTPVQMDGVELSGAATASRDGTLAFIGNTAVHPTELYVMRPDGRPVRLTHRNDALANRAIGLSREIDWTTSDGFHAYGVLTAPPHPVAGHRAPMVLMIHGGPTATSTMGFNALAQLMAARGWYVFQPNYRGSDNAGRRWAQATVPGITSSPGRDVLEGVDAVMKLGVVDPARIGVSGWSEGGLLTSWLIGHDHRWRAAMSGAAVNDWTGYADMTDAKDFSPSFIGPSPWTSDAMRARYEAESPLTYAAQVKTPTLIMTDAGDQRVPTPLSYEFYHAVRATGTPVEMVVIPVNGHFPSDPLHREDVSRRWVEWFASHF